jgi:hypothetical protein
VVLEGGCREAQDHEIWKNAVTLSVWALGEDSPWLSTNSAAHSFRKNSLRVLDLDRFLEPLVLRMHGQERLVHLLVVLEELELGVLLAPSGREAKTFSATSTKHQATYKLRRVTCALPVMGHMCRMYNSPDSPGTPKANGALGVRAVFGLFQGRKSQ